jgi:hypothetical protein
MQDNRRIDTVRLRQGSHHGPFGLIFFFVG